MAASMSAMQATVVRRVAPDGKFKPLPAMVLRKTLMAEVSQVKVFPRTRRSSSLLRI